MHDQRRKAQLMIEYETYGVVIPFETHDQNGEWCGMWPGAIAENCREWSGRVEFTVNLRPGCTFDVDATEFIQCTTPACFTCHKAALTDEHQDAKLTDHGPHRPCASCDETYERISDNGDCGSCIRLDAELEADHAVNGCTPLCRPSA